MCTPIKLAYLAIKTNQIDEMVQYYCDKLCFEELIYENDMVFLGNKQTGKISIVLEYEDQENLKVNCPLKSFHFEINDKLVFDTIKCNHPNLEVISETIVKVLDPDNNTIYISLVKNDIADQGVLLTNITIEGFYIQEEINLLNKIIDCEAIVKDNHYYLQYKNHNKSFLHFELNKDISEYSTCLDYIVFNVEDEQCLLRIKEELNQLGYDYYYNRGKQILEFVGRLNISYWFEVDGHYV